MKLNPDVDELRHILVDMPDTWDEIREAFGYLCWALVTEPGDQVAGRLIQHFGAADSFEHLLNFQHNPGGLATRLKELFVGEVSTHEDVAVASNPDILNGIPAAVRRWSPRLDSTLVKQAMTNTQRIGASILHPGSQHWPAGLAHLDAGSPHVLWARGNLQAIASLDQSVAIVGSRAATNYGEHVTYEFASGVVSHNIAVVSGGAYGIDGTAHRAALAAQGTTVAVLAGGIDRLYPSGHAELFQHIMSKNGVLLAEQAPGSSPSRWRFLQRNRIMAAITLGTLVVEAGFRSGSLNTAGHAAQLGRALGAVPGPITSAASAGAHRLIREYDAQCITTVAELCELIGVDIAEQAAEQLAEHSPEEKRVLDQLSIRYPLTVESVAKKSGISVASVERHLVLLELSGLVRQTETGWCKGAIS